MTLVCTLIEDEYIDQNLTVLQSQIIHLDFQRHQVLKFALHLLQSVEDFRRKYNKIK